jgi:transcriptional regulator GlxA family with amidase domain
MNVGIFVFHAVEVLDFAGPFQVFTTAARVAKAAGDAAPFETFVVAAEPKVVARGGLLMTPTYTLGDAPSIDVLIVPGGVVSAELDKPEVIGWIAERAAMARLTASVCTGSFLLAEAGLLDGKTATTHWEDAADLRRRYPKVTVDEGLRYVDEGNVITSAGISAGVDMSLHLVARLAGEPLARKTARQMDYRWQREP